VVRRIEMLGGVTVRRAGSHRRMRAGTHFTTVPMHGSRDIPPGTLRSIERDLEPEFGTGWSR
jgi:predicted RNA binding protein YcfA (HicA-like mRNA interferase family)